MQELYGIFTSQAELKATLPMIVSEWHSFYNTSLEFMEIWETGQSGEDWMNWIPETNVDNVTGTLQQRFWH